jgi:hypothetical protein
MSQQVKRYDMVKLSKQLETLLKGTGISCMALPETNELYLLDWIQGETSLYKTDTVLVKSDLTYRFADYVQLPPEKEVPEGVTVVTTTTREEQAKYAARQHTVYRLQQALSCIMT